MDAVGCVKPKTGKYRQAPENIVPVGIVPYLNVQPLVWWFSQPEYLSGDFARLSVIPEAPRLLAGRLRAGELATAIVPVFEYVSNPTYTVLPGASISTLERVGSVMLYAHQPIEQLRAIQLDPASLTSVNLLRVLLAERGLALEIVDKAAAVEFCQPELLGHLMIGDPALRSHGTWPFEYDLGAMWHELTGLPFVFAAWLVPAPFADLPLVELFATAKQRGVQNLEQVANQCATRFGFTPDFAIRYFQQNLCYDLGERQVAGWMEFWRLCHKHGLTPQPPQPLRMHKA